MSGWRWLKWSGVAVAAVLGFGLAVAVAVNLADGGSSGGAVSLEAAAEPEGAAPAPHDDGDERPWLGIIAIPSPLGDGIAVLDVLDDGPADRAGLERGDVITRVDGEDVGCAGDIVEMLEDMSVGDTITLTVIPDGLSDPDADAVQMDVTLTARPDRMEPFPRLREHLEIVPRARDLLDRFLGGRFSYLDDEDETVTVEVDVGEVKDVTDDDLTITLADGDDKTFPITDDARVPSDLAEGERVVVITVNGEVETVHVLGDFPFRRFKNGPKWFGPHRLPFEGFDGLDRFLPCPEEPEP